MSNNLPFWVKLWRLLVKKVGARYLWTYYLLLAAFSIAVQGVSDVVAPIDFATLWYLSALALVVGWVIAGMAWRGWLSALVNFMVGVVLAFVRAGHLEQAIWDLLSSLPPLVYQSLRYLWELAYQYGRQLWGLLRAIFSPQVTVVRPEFSSPAAPTTQLFLRALDKLGMDIGVLATRSWIWLVALLRDEPLFDPVVSRLLWSLLFCLLAFWATWQIRRRSNPLLASAPLGVMLSITLAYVWGDTYSLVLLMGTILLLMAVVNHDRREFRWIDEQVDYSQAVRSDLIWTASLVAVLLMVLAFIVPALSLDNLTDFVDKFRPARESRDVGTSLGLEQQPRPGPPTKLESARFGGMPRRHLIGTGPELSKEIVMTVSTGELPPRREAVLMADPARHYWRSATYELYTGRGWQVAQSETKSYPAGELAYTQTLTAQRSLRQKVRLVSEPSGLLYAAGTLVTVDQDYKLAWRTNDDLFAARLSEETAEYTADSLVSTAAPAELRAAGSDYPAWIRERYLSLPENIPERVTELAHDLTATQLTPYERAAAIESYLRATYPYTLEVPPPPTTLDIADYFLFELQKGYCDYYATAMVVLARSAGIPARLAIGYAPGRYLASRAQYLVTAADAHAWVEVYFPGFGWINFEPTAGRQALARYADSAAEPSPPELEELQPEPGEPESADLRFSFGRWLLRLLGAGLAALLCVALVSELDLLRLRVISPLRVSEIFYRRLRLWARRLELELQSGDTPYEFSAALQARVRLWAERSPFTAWTISADLEIDAVVEEYIQLHYSPAPERHSSESEASWRKWRLLRWRLCWLWIWRHLPQFRTLKRVSQQFGSGG